MEPSPPNAADWLAAFGTVAATVTALCFGGWAEIRLYQERKERKRADAQRVSAWLAPGEHSGDRVLCVHNGGRQPIYDVWIEHDRPQEVQSPIRIGLVPPEQTVTVRADAAVGDSWTAPLTLNWRNADERYWRRLPDGSVEAMAKDKAVRSASGEIDCEA